MLHSGGRKKSLLTNYAKTAGIHQHLDLSFMVHGGGERGKKKESSSVRTKRIEERELS